MDDIAALIESGNEVIVIDNETGDDITTTILSQLVSKNLSGNIQDAPSEVLTGILRKGGNEFFNHARRHVDFLQRAASLTSGGIDKIEDFITITKESPDQDDDRNKEEIFLQSNELKKWITDKIDEGIELSLKKSDLATEKQINNLKADIKALSAKIDQSKNIK